MKMKAKELKRILENVPDSADVIIGVNDDEYPGGGVFEELEEVLIDDDGEWVQLNIWYDID
jgi:hypothetical protein